MTHRHQETWWQRLRRRIRERWRRSLAEYRDTQARREPVTPDTWEPDDLDRW